MTTPQLSIPEVPIGAVTVGGRTFQPVQDTSFEQDIYIWQLVVDAGLQDLAQAFDLRKDSVDDISMGIVMTAFKQGRLFDLLGSVLEEDGVPWSIDTAKANAQFFAQLRDKKDKQSLYNNIASTLLGFFVSGLVSSKTFEKYSLQVADLKNESEISGETPRSSVDPTSSESGTP